MAHAASVVAAPLPELAAHADGVVHARVVSVDAEPNIGTQQFITAINLDVIECIVCPSEKTRTLSLLWPGGRRGQRQMRIPGMPVMKAGDEVVLLLEKTPYGWMPMGLKQGVFWVDRQSTASTDAKVYRDWRGLQLEGDAAALTAQHRAPTTLPVLVDSLRRWHGAGK